MGAIGRAYCGGAAPGELCDAREERLRGGAPCNVLAAADAFDDPNMMARSGNLAHEAALRSGKVNKGKPKWNID